MNQTEYLTFELPASPMSYPFPTQLPTVMAHEPVNLLTPPASTPSINNTGSTTLSTKGEKRKSEILTCDTCGIEVNSPQMMEAHIRGQKHIKKMKLKTDMNDLTPNHAEANQTAPMTENVVNPSSSLTKPTLPSSVNEKNVLQLMNELAKANKVSAKYDLIKATGPPHCKQFEVCLTVAHETYTGTGTSIKRAQQVAAEQALASTTLTKPPLVARATNTSAQPMTPQVEQLPEPVNVSDPSPPAQIQEINALDVRLHQQYVEISEDDEIVRKLLNFVRNIERALQSVSDTMMERCKMKNTTVLPPMPGLSPSTNEEDPSEAFRMLKGAMKVSALAMCLYLKQTREYELVLMCANKPYRALLNEVSRELILELDKQVNSPIQSISTGESWLPITYQVEAHRDGASLTVQCSLIPQHVIRVRFTSLVFSTEQLLRLNDQTRKAIQGFNPNPPDMLNRTKCVEALATFNHSTWFMANMLDHGDSGIVLRLLRHLQYNHSVFASLNLWCMTQLVHRCRSSSTRSVADLFRAVFGCLSSGVLLPNQIGPGLLEPSEGSVTDATFYLTTEQRLNITLYAQHVLRLLAFERFEHVFVDLANHREFDD